MQAAAIAIGRLTVSYGATTALDAVDLEIGAGQVHALLGENGAGKSTIVKVLSGLVRPNAGTVTVFGTEVRRFSPRFANDLGIRTAFQEISLVKDLTVAQNFRLMEEPRSPIATIRGGALNALVSEQLARLGVDGIDPRVEVRDLDLPSRQKIEIARAASHNPRVLLLDEPTASLTGRDVRWLGDLIQRLKQAGTTIILISHRMQEVREFCSVLTVFRNGRNVGAHAMEDVTDADVITLMIGRSLGAVFPPKTSGPADTMATPVLACDGLTTERAISDVSFSLHAGQILGLAGLDGMGQRDLFMTLFGAGAAAAGEIRVAGRQVRFRLPADAIRCGIGLVPEDRKTEALFLDLDGRENVSLPSLREVLQAGLVRFGRERSRVSSAFDVVKVAKRALWTRARNFSGGNQQKIVVAKWLLTKTRALLLYDPTRGIDIATKAEIYRLIRRYADAGGAVLFYSTEIPELVNLCDRIMVIYRGRIVETLAGESLSEAAVLNAAVGGRQGDGAAAAPSAR